MLCMKPGNQLSHYSFHLIAESFSQLMKLKNKKLLFFVQTNQKKREFPYMEISRDNDQKWKDSPYMEKSRDNDKKEAYKKKVSNS